MANLGKADVTRSAMLAYLGSQGPATRAALARGLGISPALVTSLSRDLVAEGLIEEGEEERPETGRPGRRLQLAPGSTRAIGVKIAADHVACVEVALDGAVVRSASEGFDATDPMFITDLVSLLRRFIAGGDGSTLLGLGIGVPGEVDAQDSGVVESPTLGWQKVPLGHTLRAELSLPVIVENNVNALAVAERLYGLGRAHTDFLVVTIGSGVGSAIVSAGVVQRGAHGGAGEFGHIPVWFNDGTGLRYGTLESFISAEALTHRAVARGLAREGASLEAVAAAADRGGEQESRLFAEAGHALGSALAGAIQLIDPEVVIISGEGTTAWSHWEIGFEQGLRPALMATRRGVPVAIEAWQDEGWARGAAALVLATPFDAAGVAGAQGARVRARLQGGATR